MGPGKLREPAGGGVGDIAGVSTRLFLPSTGAGAGAWGSRSGCGCHVCVCFGVCCQTSGGIMGHLVSMVVDLWKVAA